MKNRIARNSVLTCCRFLTHTLATTCLQPNRPPVPYVRLAPNMYLKENHRHVGSDGKVYLPYLHEWRSHSHNLVELIVAMSSVFSAEPPVFTKRPGQGDSAAQSASVQATAIPTNGNSTTTQSNNISDNSNNNNNHSRTNNSSATVTPSQVASGAMMSDAEAIAAVQAQEAQEERRRIEEERKRLEDERKRAADQERKAQEQRDWEQRRTEQLRVQVTAKVRQQVQEEARKVQLYINQDLARNVRKMELAKEQKILRAKEQLQQQRQELQQQVAIAEEATEDAKAWIQQAKEQKERSNGNTTATQQPALSIDDKVAPSSRVHAQMMELSAENAAITDCLYFLDRALHQNYVSCEKHLKQVRKLAKRQFLVRAHLIKIHQVLIAENNTNNRQ